MPSQKPTQPPGGADFSALVKKVNELATKTGLAPLNTTITGKIPAWKRWVGAEKPDYDGTGLRDTVNANALYLDDVKDDLDNHKDVDNTRHTALAARVSALEAQGEPPFPIA